MDNTIGTNGIIKFKTSLQPKNWKKYPESVYSIANTKEKKKAKQRFRS
jgi:hypothetical protein